MEIITANVNKPSKMQKGRFSLRNLRLSLKFRPEIMRLVLKMRHKIRKKTQLLNILKQRLENQSSSQTPNAFTQTENTTEDIVVSKIPTSYKEDESTDNHQNTKHQNASTQTDETSKLLDKSPITEQNTTKTNEVKENSNLEGAKELNVASDENGGWKLGNDNSESGKSIAEQVKEAAQSAMQQSGMVYMESAGMYYDYKTGYYYSSELGLYYHPETGCYYQYSEDKQTFEFHPYPDRSKTATNALYEAHEKKKARKLRKARQREEQDIENLTKNLSQGKEDDQGSKAKRRKKSSKKTENGDEKIEKKTDSDCKEEILEKEKASVDGEAIFDGADKEVKPQDLEEGECSESDHEKEDEKDVDEESVESDASVSTVSDDDDDSIAKHHPPSMRVIVRESNLTKLKVGSLFLVTKHGGTVGRQGSSHTILIEDTNVSRNHLDIKYDMSRRIYTITDLGSKNGTTLNGVRISESQIISEPVEVMHGSTLQLGETKLLCHIHPGIDTCGHCEPGLVMEKSAAIKILTRGVELDTKKRYTEALVCYQEGLQILVDKMKGTLKKVEEYMKRAETIKKLVLQQKEAGKFHEQVHIENNSTGHSYKSLFGRFLDDDVQYVVVEDPYIRSFHQCQNLLRLCELLVKTCCNLRHIKLVTSRGGKSEGGQRNWFHSLNEDLQKYRVNLAVEYSETLHDRQITLSSGWIIKIGRGLDFFKPPENKFCLGVYDMDLRQCHETTVDIVHSKNVKQSYG